MGDISYGELEKLPLVARRELVVLLVERGQQPRHLIHVAPIIKPSERQRPHAAAVGKMQEHNGGVVAGQELRLVRPWKTWTALTHSCMSIGVSQRSSSACVNCRACGDHVRVWLSPRRRT